MAAETGSGKTGAFCLPVLQITWESLKDLQDKKKGSGGASASSSASNNDDSGWRMSVLDRGPAIAISPDGLQAQSRHQKEWHGCRANNGVSNRGMYYYEAIVTDEGLCRIGFSTGSASLDLGTQCGKFLIFLSLRFYVKSNLANLQAQNLPFSYT